MGFTPQEADQMTPWEYAVCLEAWNRSKGGDDAPPSGPPMSIERMRELGIEGV